MSVSVINPSHSIPRAPLSSHFRDIIQSLQAERRHNHQPGKPLVTILGAGPGGLIRAIESLVNGNPTQVLERRMENANARPNIVALKGDSIDLLKHYGIYDYLVDNQLVYPAEPSLTVRLEDLERAMREVISQLTTDPVICYDAKVKRIDRHAGAYVDLIVEDHSGNERRLAQNSLVVVTEGSRSHTNELLNNPRIDTLQRIPVIAATFADKRPSICDIPSFFTYVAVTVQTTGTSIYYYTIFFFKFIFQQDHFFNPQRTIAGSLVLQTPGHYYLGSGLSAGESEKLLAYEREWSRAKEAFNQAVIQGNPEEIARYQHAFEQTESARATYLRHWAYSSICFANLLNLMRAVIGEPEDEFTPWHIFHRITKSMVWAPLQPIDQLNVVEIGADRAQHTFQKIDATAFLIAGDALATVDPTTGLGCRTAIESSVFFANVLHGIDQGLTLDPVLEQYRLHNEDTIRTIHAESVRMRRTYRPDAVGAVSA